jgi:hypothetical protein
VIENIQISGNQFHEVAEMSPTRSYNAWIRPRNYMSFADFGILCKRGLIKFCAKEKGQI